MRTRVPAIALFLSVLVACGSSNNAGTSSSGAASTTSAPTATSVPATTAAPTTTSQAGTAATKGAAGAGGATFVKLDDFVINPSTLTAKPAQTMKIDITNVGKNLHNFSIPSLGISQDVKAGELASVSVTLPSEGSSIPFLCKYHSERGMRGELKLTP